MILADLPIGSQTRKVIMQAPKNGFFYVLDRTDGKLISGQPYAYTSWATRIDMETGRPRETEQARYRYTPVRLSPSPVGAHHWPPMAFNPVTKLVYYPGQETAVAVAMEERFEYQEGRWNLGLKFGSGSSRNHRPPDPKAPKPGGFFVAWDPIAQQGSVAHSVPVERRRVIGGRSVDLRRQQSTGKFMALDPLTGKTLWEQQLQPGVATPISYELDGKQYIAVMSGVSKGKSFRLRARCERDDAAVSVEADL